MLLTHPKSYLILGFSIIITVIGLDQFTKWFVLYYLGVIETPIRVASFFNLITVWNYGVSFGLFAKHGAGNIWMLSTLAIGISGILFTWMWRAKSMYLSTALGLVIGGALGNVIDRIRYGAVADFLDFHIEGFHWYAFNLADSTIFIGVVLLLFDSFIRREGDQNA
jgi:signal peptidase II